jgi:hypothetical protein
MVSRCESLSWLSNKTGRRKEEGGHKLITISISKKILKLIRKRKTKNLSKYIEDCVRTSFLTEYEIKWINALWNSGNRNFAYRLACHRLFPNRTVSLKPRKQTEISLKYLERKTE